MLFSFDYRDRCSFALGSVFGLTIFFGLGMLLSAGAAEPSDSPGTGAAAAKSPPESPSRSPSQAITKAAVDDSFLVFPIRTELQRAAGVKFEKANVFVLINGTDVIKGQGELLNARALKLDRIWKAIEPFAKGEPANVVFEVWIDKRWARRSSNDGAWPATSILMEALEQFGRHIGFEEAEVTVRCLTRHHPYAGKWKRAVSDCAEYQKQQNVDEIGVGDEVVKVYPVRTRLSRILYRGDCVIHIVPPIEEVDIVTTIKTMKRCVPQLDLKAKEEVVFFYNWKDPAVATEVRNELAGKQVSRDALGFRRAAQQIRN